MTLKLEGARYAAPQPDNQPTSWEVTLGRGAVTVTVEDTTAIRELLDARRGYLSRPGNRYIRDWNERSKTQVDNFLRPGEDVTLWRATNRKGELFGAIRLEHNKKYGRGEIAYYLIHSAENRRRMKQVLSALKQHAFTELDCKLLVAHAYNSAAEVLEAAGFLKTYYDTFESNFFAFKPDLSEGDTKIIGYAYQGEPIVRNGFDDRFIVDTSAPFETREQQALEINNALALKKDQRLQDNHKKLLDVLRDKFGTLLASFDGVVPRRQGIYSRWEDIPVVMGEIGHSNLSYWAQHLVPTVESWWDMLRIESWLIKTKENQTFSLVEIRREPQEEYYDGFTELELKAILTRTNASFYFHKGSNKVLANPYL